MRKRQLTAAIIGSFMLAAGIFSLTGTDSAWAQRASKVEKHEAVLSSVAGYKTWKLVSKPALGLAEGTLRITDSAFAG